MMNRTRYFVIASLLVMSVGLGTGLVAYYVGFPAGAFANRGGPDELQFIPRDAAVIAYANVQEIMTSELRQKLRGAIPLHENGQREFENQTGINIETDVDRIVACMNPNGDGGPKSGAGLVLARGRFDVVKIEALMRDRGGQVEEYKGKRLVVANIAEHPTGFAVAFIEPGLVGVGTADLVRQSVDLHQGGDNPQTGAASVTGNEELMSLVRSLDTGNAWAVGRFDSLMSRARLPQDVANRIPAITWFAVSGHINGGLRGVIRAETRDDEAANNLRDVLRGFMALGKLQGGSKPEVQLMLNSLELGGTGKTVALSFSVPAEVFDAITSAIPKREKPPGH